MPSNSFSYRDVSDLYRTLKSAGAVSQDLPTWSAEMNRLSGSNLYDAGLNDNFIKQSSANIDRALEWTGLPKAAEGVGRAIGRPLGQEEYVGQMFGGFPRMGTNILAGLAAGALAPEALGAAAVLGGTAAMFGADTYEKTGSPAAGILSGGIAAAMGPAAGFAERGALRALGTKEVTGTLTNLVGENPRVVSQFFPNAGQRLGGFAASQAAQGGLMEASKAGQAALDPNSEYQFDPVQAALDMTLGVLPFTAAHLAGKVVGRAKGFESPAAMEQALAASRVREWDAQQRKKAATAPPNADVPNPGFVQEPDPVALASLNETIRQVQGKKEELGTPEGPDAIRQWNELDAQEQEAYAESLRAGGTGVGGRVQTPEDPRFVVSGTEHFYNPKTGYRIIKVGDDPGNVQQGYTPGQLIGYSTLHEPAPRDMMNGAKAWSVPKEWSDTTVKDNRAIAQASRDAERLVQNPDLPLQPETGIDPVVRAREQAADFSEVKAKLDAVQPGDLDGYRKGLNAYNLVLQKHGYEPLTDAQVEERAAKFGVTKEAAVKGAANERVIAAADRETRAQRTERELTERRAKLNAAVTAADTPEAKAEAQRITAIMALHTRGSDSFAKVYSRWEADGKPEGLVELAARASYANKHGGDGVPKGGRETLTPLVDKLQAAAKTQTADTVRARMELRSVAEEATEHLFKQGGNPDLQGDAQQFIDAFTDGTINLPENRELMSRPWAKEWLQDAKEIAEDRGLKNAMPEVAAPKASAGGGFVWDFVPYDEGTNRLGKHTLPKTGVLHVSQFKNMAGDPVLSDTAIALGRLVVPEAFNGDNVNVKVLFQGLKEKGPVVEVKKLGQNEEQTANDRETARIEHELDTVWPTWSVTGEPPNERARQLIEEYSAVRDRVLNEPPQEGGSARYSFLGPKSEQDMPGYVEGLVRAKMPDSKRFEELADKADLSPDEIREFQQLQKNPESYYTGPHFGSEDTNVLAFFRGYEETLPDGRKAFHVIEVQSDWGQRQSKGREARKQWKTQETATGNYRIVNENGSSVGQDTFPTEKAAQERLEVIRNQQQAEADASGHPLLSVYEPLALKAAIEHARSVGADAIILSDAETAMMTEGHDRAARSSVQDEFNVPFKTREQALEAGRKDAEQYAGSEPEVKARISLRNLPALSADQQKIVRTLAEDGAVLWSSGKNKNAYLTLGNDVTEVPKTKLERLVNLGILDTTAEGPDTNWHLQGDWTYSITLRRPKIDQEGGMRLHYDTTLPSAMKKLTGEKGERVEVGVHDKAKQPNEVGVSGSPVFGTKDHYVVEGKEFATSEEAIAYANSIGKPQSYIPEFVAGEKKKNITGRLYDLRAAFAKQDAQGGFTLTRPNAAGGSPRTAVEPKVWTPTTEAERARVAELGLDSGGPAAIAWLKRTVASPDPKQAAVNQALVRDLETAFPEALRRVQILLMEQSHEGSATQIGANRVLLRLSKDLIMNATPERQFEVVAHELIHGLTLDALDDPRNAQHLAAFDALRQRLVAKLPAEVKQHFEKLVGEGWYEKYSESLPGGEWERLAKPAATGWEEVIYGLMNPKELVTQGFTGERMREFMGRVKAEPAGADVRTSVLQRWYQGIKRMLKLSVDDTELARFINISSNILQHGNYVADVANGLDTYFASRGLDPFAVKDRTGRALGLIQSADRRATTLSMLRQALRQQTTESSALRKFRATYEEHVAENQAPKDILAEVGIDYRDLDAFVLSQATEGGRDMELALSMLPKEVTDYLYAKAQDAMEVIDGVRSVSEGVNNGLNNIAKPERLNRVSKEAMAGLATILEHQSEVEAGRIGLQRLLTALPDAFADAALSVPSPGKPGPKATADFANPDAPKGWFDRAYRQLAPLFQMARTDPKIAEYAMNALTMNARADNHVREVFTPWSDGLYEEGRGDTKVSGKKRLQQWLKDRLPGRTNEAIDKAIYAAQKLGKNAVGPLDLNGPEFKAATARLTPEEAKHVVEAINLVRAGNIAHSARKLDYYRNIMALEATGPLMTQTGMKLEPALKLTTQLFDAFNANWNDPAAAAAANAQIQQVTSQMPLDAAAALAKSIQAGVGLWQELSNHLAKNPDWVTGQRMKAYTYLAKKNGVWFRFSANSRAEAEQFAGGKENIREWKKNERSEDSALDFGNATKEQLEKLKQYEAVQRDYLVAGGATPEALAKFDKFSVALQAERDASYLGNRVSEAQAGRTLGPGAEHLPWLENHFSYIEKDTRYWHRRLLKAQAEALAAEPGTKDTDTGNYILQHAEQTLSQDPEAGKLASRLTSAWALPFNLAGAMANATQTFMRGVPELIRLGHGYGSALNEMLGAWRDLTGKRLENKPFRNEEEAKAYAWFKKNGLLDSTMRDEEAASQVAFAADVKRVLNRDKPMSAAQHASNALEGYTNTGMMLWKMGDHANNAATLLAAFRTLTKFNPEMPFEKRLEQAAVVNGSVNDTGGRVNRAIGPFSLKGELAQTVMMSMMALRSYSLGSTMQLIRHLKSGLFRPEGLTPAEVYSARKAAVYQLAVQFAAAGTLGMPFASASLALLNQFFPELEVNKRIRESVSSLFGSDGSGQMLTDASLVGLPSMLGWDWQSRLSAGNMLPGLDEYRGFQSNALLGVPGQFLGNIVRGAQKVASGDLSGGSAFLPLPFKKLADLAVEGGTAKDYRGRPILSPTPGEFVGRALGFQPKRLVDYNAADRMAQQSEHLAIVRRGQENQRLAEEVLKGNFGTVRAQLQQAQNSDKNYNPVDAVRSIARAAEEMTFPKDLRREGSRRDMGTRSRLLSSFNLDPSSQSEVLRLQFRRQIEQRLGLRSTDTTAVRRAQLMDALRAERPDATRAELAAAADAALRRTAPQELGPGF